MFAKMLEQVQIKKPLIHNITNYVTVNDCANILIACGASPIMADEPEEVEEITRICAALNINIGTLNTRTVKAMFQAGKTANTLKHPIVLDPVGAGASNYRTKVATNLIKDISFSVIRANISEMKALAGMNIQTKGVDANTSDNINTENLANIIDFAKEFSKKTSAVIAITGAIDIVADETHAYIIKNGHPMMSKLSGTGCMLSAMLGAYIAANPKDILQSTAAAVCAMGLCGEIAYKKLHKTQGNLAYKIALFDEIFNLSPHDLQQGALYDIQ